MHDARENLPLRRQRFARSGGSTSPVRSRVQGRGPRRMRPSSPGRDRCGAHDTVPWRPTHRVPTTLRERVRSADHGGQKTGVRELGPSRLHRRLPIALRMTIPPSTVRSSALTELPALARAEAALWPAGPARAGHDPAILELRISLARCHRESRESRDVPTPAVILRESARSPRADPGAPGGPCPRRW